MNIQRPLQRAALIFRAYSFTRLRAPILTAAKWSATALALAVIVPILLLSTRRASVRASTRMDPLQPVALTLTGEGGRMSAGWDREAPAIRSAECGVLLIADGSVRRRVILDASQLRAGKLFYWPLNKDVSFELTILGGNNAGGELCANNSSRSLQPRQLATQQVQQGEMPQRNRRKTIHKEEESNSRKFALIPLRKPAVSRIEMPDAPLVAGLVPQVAVDKQILAVGEPVLPGAPLPFASVAAEGVTGNRRRTREIIPPKPLREDVPAVPLELRRDLKEETAVNVRVFVDERGKVRYAELLSDLDSIPRGFASLAVFNARRWEFIPARLEGHAVPGAAILHYKFGNPLLATSRAGP